MKIAGLVCASIALSAVLVGCAERAKEGSSASTPAVDVDGKQFTLSAEPKEAKSVIDARKAAKDNEEVVVVGRIGGSQSPWVADRAAFSIVDASLKACSDIPGDSCSTPWDYCCETDKLPKATALVKVVDGKGTLVNVDARKLLKVKELQTVVVRGKAKRDEAGNLTILTTGIYPRR